MMFMSLSGFVCQWIYKNSPKRAINITDVQHTIRELERSADTKMNDIEGILENDRVDSLMWIPFEKLLVTFLVFEDNQLIFWSDNQVEPENLKNRSAFPANSPAMPKKSNCIPIRQRPYSAFSRRR